MNRLAGIMALALASSSAGIAHWGNVRRKYLRNMGASDGLLRATGRATGNTVAQAKRGAIKARNRARNKAAHRG